MNNFILWINDRPAPPAHVGGFSTSPKFSNMISHMGSDMVMRRFKKKKRKLRKAK